MIEAKCQDTAQGAILFDAAVLAQAGVAEFDPAWFDAAFWRAQQRSRDVRGGRGNVTFVDAPFGACVIRHYRRGGMVANLFGDNYLWTGATRSRAFAEFRLLSKLCELGLDVPPPVAARYERNGFSYRADLITRRIENAPTLADVLVAHRCTDDMAERVGTTLAAFHRAGAFHADLNAHNILVGDDKIWIIDFDRGRLRVPTERWRRRNLQRLHRSLVKISNGADVTNVWSRLLQSYERAFATEAPAWRSVRT
ncbi:MAG: 3-deoxy-D-manno-octulosonic acid kinase [Rudaea sp.]